MQSRKLRRRISRGSRRNRVFDSRRGKEDGEGKKTNDDDSSVHPRPTLAQMFLLLSSLPPSSDVNLDEFHQNKRTLLIRANLIRNLPWRGAFCRVKLQPRSTGASATSTTASVGRLWSVCGTGEGEKKGGPLSLAESLASLRPCPRPRRPFAFAQIPAHTFTRSLSRSLLSSPRVLPTPIHFAHAYILARQIFAGISNDRRLPRKFSPMWRSFTAFSASVSLTSTCPEEGRRRRGAGNSVPFLNQAVRSCSRLFQLLFIVGPLWIFGTQSRS